MAQRIVVLALFGCFVLLGFALTATASSSVGDNSQVNATGGEATRTGNEDEGSPTEIKVDNGKGPQVKGPQRPTLGAKSRTHSGVIRINTPRHTDLDYVANDNDKEGSWLDVHKLVKETKYLFSKFFPSYEKSGKCPNLDARDVNMYPKSQCVYPQDTDAPDGALEKLEAKAGKNVVTGLFSNVLRGMGSKTESRMTEAFMKARSKLISGDEFYKTPRDVSRSPTQPAYAWDVVMNGRTRGNPQQKRRINRFKHKEHLFPQGRAQVKEFFSIESPAEKCADTYLTYMRTKEEFEHDDNPPSSNGRRVLRRVFPAAHVFFHPGIRKKIESSKMFDLAKKFPKGAILHSHFWSLSSAEFLAKMMIQEPSSNTLMAVEGNTVEDLAYNAAYEDLVRRVMRDDENAVLNNPDKLQRDIYVCGSVEEMIDMFDLEALFDTTKVSLKRKTLPSRTNCEFYEKKIDVDPQKDGSNVPVGTMSFFPVNPNPKEGCKVYNPFNNECKDLEVELFLKDDKAPTWEKVLAKIDLKPKNGKLDESKVANTRGWRNLHDELKDPMIVSRLAEIKRRAMERAKKANVFCPDGCIPERPHELPLAMEGLSWFLDGPPERLILLTYFQMGYWDWHPLVQSRELWEKLEATWMRTGNVAKYFPFFNLYVADTQRRLLADNVQLLEARHKPGALYNYASKGQVLMDKYSAERELEQIDEITSQMNNFVKGSEKAEFEHWANFKHKPNHLYNQAKIKVIAFERRIGQAPVQSKKMEKTLNEYDLLTKEIAKPCTDPRKMFGKVEVDLAKSTYQSTRSGCGIVAGIDYAGEEAAFYYYGLGDNRDLARHFFNNIKGASAKLGESFSNKYLNPHHSGESNNAENYNMFDSFITQWAAGFGRPDERSDKLGRPMRFGHGIALEKFPHLEELLLGEEDKPNNVLIEVNPISNQVLGYVPDLRNHPGLSQMRKGLAIALSFDDPSQFGYSDVSFDWYQALTAWKLDLADMKELALNSIAFSSLSPEEQREVFDLWYDRYVMFLNEVTSEAAALLQGNAEQISNLKAPFQPLSHHMDPLLNKLLEDCGEDVESMMHDVGRSPPRAKGVFHPSTKEDKKPNDNKDDDVSSSGDDSSKSSSASSSSDDSGSQDTHQTTDSESVGPSEVTTDSRDGASHEASADIEANATVLDASSSVASKESPPSNSAAPSPDKGGSGSGDDSIQCAQLNNSSTCGPSGDKPCMSTPVNLEKCSKLSHCKVDMSDHLSFKLGVCTNK